MEKFIFCERVNSEFKNAEAWRCGIRIKESGKSYARLDLLTALKAYRYMVYLAKKEYVKIDLDCKAMILAEVKKEKEAAPKAEDAKTAQPEVKEATAKTEAPAKKKTTGRTKKEKAA